MSEGNVTSSGSGAPSGSGSGGTGTPKAIASLAKKPTDTTRMGTAKMKFVPTLPVRRKKEEVKQEPAATTISSGRGQGRGSGRGHGDSTRGGASRGRGSAPRSAQEMTASGPFAMGPTLAGSSSTLRRSTPRSHTPIVPLGPSGSSALGAGLTKAAAPSLKRERGQGGEGGMGRVGGVSVEGDAEVYSDNEDGVEIVDMENVRTMDWMAPESLRKERGGDKRKRKVEKIKREEHEAKADKEKAKEEPIEIDSITPSLEGTPATSGEVDLANALDLSESEDEEEMEDLIDDFAAGGDIDDGTGVANERLYFFQFPTPFPTYVQKRDVSEASGEAMAVDKGKAREGSEKRVSFTQDTKPAAGATTTTPANADSGAETTHVDGIIGQLEIYESGAVKMRLHNGILLDVSAATQPSFLQQAVHIDRRNKHVNVLGEVSRRFVVTPNVDTLLDAMAQDDEAASAKLEDTVSNGMDTT